MTKLTIGRVGLDFDLDGVTQWSHDGDQLSITVEVYSTLAQALVVRQQILGYVGSPDEEFVAVTWSEEPAANGYYMVDSASVTPDTSGRDVFTMDVRLTRFQGYAMPLIETAFVQQRRTNAWGLTGDTYPIMGTPGDTKFETLVDVPSGTFFSGDAGVTWTGQTGTVREHNLQASTDGNLSLFQRSIPAAAFYNGAATLKAAGNVVVGRQMPAGHENSWEISNGLIRLTPSTAGDLAFIVENWRNSLGAWSTPTTFKIMIGATAATRLPALGIYTVTVLRNNPEEVAIRVTIRANATRTHTYLDITLRRGWRVFAARLYAVTQGTTSFYPGIQSTALEDAGFDDTVGMWTVPTTFVSRNGARNPRLTFDGTWWTNIGGSGVYDGTTPIDVYRATATGSVGASGLGVRNGSGGASGRAVVEPGLYAARLYVRSTVASREVQLRVRFFNAAGAEVTAHASGTQTLNAIPSGSYTQITHTGTAPAGTVDAEIEVVGAGATGWTSGQSIEAGLAQIENGMSSLPAFWDGDSADAGNRFMWEGIEFLSTSLKFTDVATQTGNFWLAAPLWTKKDIADGSIVVPWDAGTMQHNVWDFGFGQWITGVDTTVATLARGYMNILSSRDSVIVQ